MLIRKCCKEMGVCEVNFFLKCVVTKDASLLSCLIFFFNIGKNE